MTALAPIARVEIRDEMLGIIREPAAILFSIVMPVAFFALFVGLFGTEHAADQAVPTGTLMLATFGTYGVLGAGMLSPGISLAESREAGWLRVQRVSPVPLPLILGAKVVAAFPYCVGILGAMTLTAGVMGVLEIGILEWLALVALMVVSVIPFALIGMAVGAQASGNATTAILNAIIMPMAIASGLWFPLEMMPEWVAQIAPVWPTYHLSQLALGVIDAGPLRLGNAVALLGFATVAALVAAVSYRRARI